MRLRALVWVVSAAFVGGACTTNTVDESVGAGGTGVSSTTTTGSGGGTANEYVALVPQQGVAETITLTVYSDGWGTLLDTITVATEGPVVIDVEETDPYTDPSQYYVYAVADGYYTEVYSCIKGGSIDVDLDAVPDRSQAVAGVVFAQQGFFADRPLADTNLHLVGPGVDTTIRTDAQGRYGVEGLPLGAYSLQFTYQDTAIQLQLTNGSATTDYADLFFDEPMQAS